MYSKVKFICKEMNKPVEGILLATFTMKEESIISFRKKKWFFQKNQMKTVLRKPNMDVYLVFIPWKHRMKDIEIIKKENIIFEDEQIPLEWITLEQPYISTFDVTWTNFIIDNYRGYEFITKETNFIANTKYKETYEITNILYQYMPQLLNEEYDEEKEQ